jgi:radical SAM superfamily enzyme YgiQ (UPF0313 family)
MKILLIDIVRTSIEEIWPAVEHSLGLMYLASSIKKEYQDQTTVKVHTQISKSNQDEIERVRVLNLLEDYKPDLVGIRSLSIGKDSLKNVVKVISQWNNDCFIVVGGPCATDEPEFVLRSGFVDCVVIGEGELTFNELVGRLMNRDTYKDINGIAYLEEGQLVRTKPRKFIADLNNLPYPDYSLIDLDAFNNQYLTFTSKVYQRHANILTTRGCPYRCAYCHNIAGKIFRTRSPQSVFSEISFLHDQYEITDFQIIDDIFNLDLDRAKAICDLIIKSPMELTFSFPNGVRGDRMDEELIEKLAAAGTKFMSYAIETASPRLQRLIKKNLNLKKIFKAIEHTTRCGIATRGFFMIGFPTETEEEVIQTIEFAKASSLTGATFFTVVYFPGTGIYELARSLGYFKNESYDTKRDYVQVADGPYDFSLERLRELKKKAIIEFAFTKERIENALDILPGYFTPREINNFLMAYVVSSQLTLNDIKDESIKHLLKRYFVVSERFSKKNEFYV